MADFDSYIENLERVKEQREKLALHIKYNCESTKKLKDWQLHIFNRNEGEYIVRIFNIDQLTDKSLLEDPAFKKLFDTFMRLYNLCEARGLIWRADFPSENPDRLRIDSKIRSLDADIEILMSNILNREMNETEYNSVLNYKHKIYKELSDLEGQIHNFDEKEFSRKQWRKDLQNRK